MNTFPHCQSTPQCCYVLKEQCIQFSLYIFPSPGPESNVLSYSRVRLFATVSSPVMSLSVTLLVYSICFLLICLCFVMISLCFSSQLLPSLLSIVTCFWNPLSRFIVFQPGLINMLFVPLFPASCVCLHSGPHLANTRRFRTQHPHDVKTFVNKCSILLVCQSNKNFYSYTNQHLHTQIP